ncbi:MAG: class I SAM-dependent methyltransferase, partial [Candidatus Aenigmarchaeota archaeon]|nr:class I SAM-dependent methyltransferase [Candidatus Aenigmarchaeota archaeon]
MPEVLYTKGMLDWYDKLYCSDENTPEQMKFLTKIFKKKKVKKILDISCGTGRHSIGLAKAGYNVTGVDKEKSVIDYAKNKAKESGVHAKFMVQSMESLRLKEKFDAAIMMYGSLAYLTSNENILKCLFSVKKLLKPDGMIIIEDDNPWQDVAGKKLTVRYKLQAQKEKMTVKHAIRIHPENNLIDIKSSYERYKNNRKLPSAADKKPVTLRIFSKNEMELLLALAGFDDVTFYSSFSGKKFSKQNYKKL